jgi:hypothetical protein
MFEGATPSDADADCYVIIEVIKFYFQHSMGIKIATLEVTLNTQDRSSETSPPGGMTLSQICFT